MNKYNYRWAQLTQKLAPLLAIPLIENTSFVNVNPITQFFRKRNSVSLLTTKILYETEKTKNQFYILYRLDFGSDFEFKLHGFYCGSF